MFLGRTDAEAETPILWPPDVKNEFFGGSEAETDYSRVKTVPDIVYEDENILLCNKKPGVLVHLGDEGDRNTAEGAERETLIFALTAYLVNKGEYNPDSEASFAPALCNRIDRNTGGIVILAKNASALRAVNEAIRENRVEKRYLCAVHGKLTGEKTLSAWHSKDYKTNTVRVFDDRKPGTRRKLRLWWSTSGGHGGTCGTGSIPQQGGYGGRSCFRKRQNGARLLPAFPLHARLRSPVPSSRR